MPNRATESPALRGFNYVGLTLFALMASYPLVLTARIALRTDDDAGFGLTNFRTLLADPAFIRSTTNTALLALAAAGASVIIAAAIGYVLSRSSVGRRNGTARHSYLFVTQLLPATMLLLPLYLGAARLGVINSYVGAILLYAATALPFCIWLLKRCYDRIPVELEAAAILDGCSRSQSYRLIVLPLIRSALAVAALLSFLTFWSERFILSALLRDSPVFSAANSDPKSSSYAAALCLICIVALALFVILTCLRSRCVTSDNR
jgi:arabinogalactan oligomer/maltooligosaccharide transport system permease protein